jgi:hypothetical protein
MIFTRILLNELRHQNLHVAGQNQKSLSSSLRVQEYAPQIRPFVWAVTGTCTKGIAYFSATGLRSIWFEIISGILHVELARRVAIEHVEQAMIKFRDEYHHALRHGHIEHLPGAADFTRDHPHLRGQSAPGSFLLGQKRTRMKNCPSSTLVVCWSSCVTFAAALEDQV